MNISDLQLYNFKNYSSLKVSFSGDINIITGKNGSGKTNLMDSVYFLSYGKSAFNPTDYVNIKEGNNLMSVKGTFRKNEKNFLVSVGLEKKKKKVINVNKKTVSRLADHIGEFPLVLLTPYDTDLIRKGSEERRKFMDGIIAQTDREFLNALLNYNKLLRQRNALLKRFAEEQKQDLALLEIYNDSMIPYGETIINKRVRFLEDFRADFRENYSFISSKAEETMIIYNSEGVDVPLRELFSKSLKKDLILQRTTAGPHKDDLDLLIRNNPVKSFGSQGQQKSFTTALKLASFQILQKKLGLKPVLMLDDIFDKLDELRIRKLLELVAEKSFGQVLITDARLERSRHYFSDIKAEKKVFTIDNGEITSSDKL